MQFTYPTMRLQETHIMPNLVLRTHKSYLIQIPTVDIDNFLRPESQIIHNATPSMRHISLHHPPQCPTYPYRILTTTSLPLGTLISVVLTQPLDSVAAFEVLAEPAPSLSLPPSLPASLPSPFELADLREGCGVCAIDKLSDGLRLDASSTSSPRAFVFGPEVVDLLVRQLFGA
ncbi:hypothetical protein EJ03DRAFT_167641 [Teratosphaeria nubilosa]|uniref:Uncharacterized protein n=1 Tax=Teratosphaeria nubilosa TaxID=161662 RepID=A0A6G1L1R2_9PEZI|nr:hypothetical protein EJ03DRAFT_167641 [Teratosphaeria nubilosa]